ncbi:MAG: hypothetical protein H6737_16685 [Alphaproteobacteria bacterium]|nr:hypothetical protein [Alphaproteobacteria bacterium]
MVELAGVEHRYSASEGERHMLHAVKGRLPDDLRGRIEGFVAWSSPVVVIGFHAAGLLAAGVLGLKVPLLGFALCAGFTASLWAENTGSFSLFRRIAPKAPSYNLIVPMPRPQALGTVVISAPLDAPAWRPDRPKWFRRPLKAVFGAAVVVTTLLGLSALAQPWGRPTQGMYLGSLVVLGVTVGLGFLMRRRARSVGEDASGPAALLEIVRRFHDDPPEHTELWAVFTGCGHAYQNGMAAFLAMHGQNLPQPVFVLALDDPGRPPVGGVVSEGVLFAQRHRPTGPALVERLRWAGVEIPAVDKAGVTDAHAAMLFGYRALALSGDEDSEPDPDTALRACDVAERIVRWFDEDLARVADDAALLEPMKRRPEAVEPDASEKTA